MGMMSSKRGSNRTDVNLPAKQKPDRNQNCEVSCQLCFSPPAGGGRSRRSCMTLMMYGGQRLRSATVYFGTLQKIYEEAIKCGFSLFHLLRLLLLSDCVTH